jgi:hypothetical protein
MKDFACRNAFAAWPRPLDRLPAMPEQLEDLSASTARTLSQLVPARSGLSAHLRNPNPMSALLNAITLANSNFKYDGALATQPFRKHRRDAKTQSGKD